MNETLQQMLGKLPEIRKRMGKHGRDVGAQELFDTVCDALQAAAYEIQQLQRPDTIVDANIDMAEQIERLQAEKEQLSNRLKEAETAIAQVKVLLDIISELQGGEQG